jgi:hypothetical protein
MVLPAWPPLAGPASPALLLRPELLHAMPTRPARRMAATVLFRSLLGMGGIVSSCITREDGTAFPVHRMLKKTGGAGAFLGKAELCVCLWSVSLFCCLVPRIPEQHRHDASDVVTACCSLALINIGFSLTKGPFASEIAL